MPEQEEEELKPSTANHDRETGTLEYELGRAEVQRPNHFAASEAYCYPETSNTSPEDLRTKDWLLPVFASSGRIVLRADVSPEAAHIRYDGDALRALVWNDVFADFRETSVDREDVEALLDRAESLDLVPRDQSRWAERDLDGE